MLGIGKADTWNGPFVVSVSAGLVYSLLELSLGAGNFHEPAALEGRGFTSIETAIARVLFEAILGSAEEAFSTVSKVNFAIERFETSPRFAAIAPPATLVALAKFRIEMGGVSGEFDIAIPYLALEPVRHLLLTDYSGDGLGNDEIWANHLAAQAAASETRLSAILFEGRFPLARVAALGVGDTLLLSTKPGDSIDLRCGEVVFAKARMGRLDRNVAVRVDSLQGMKP
jgi:flagellar motor switch protein FliM